jgi:hypothetical protein
MVLDKRMTFIEAYPEANQVLGNFLVKLNHQWIKCLSIPVTKIFNYYWMCKPLSKTVCGGDHLNHLVAIHF